MNKYRLPDGSTRPCVVCGDNGDGTFDVLVAVARKDGMTGQWRRVSAKWTDLVDPPAVEGFRVVPPVAPAPPVAPVPPASPVPPAPPTPKAKPGRHPKPN
jgi:hypothetical protein